MFPQDPGMNRSPPFPSSSQLPLNSVQGIPGMPPSAGMAAGPPTGFDLQHNFVGNMSVAPGSVNLQQNQSKLWQQNHQQTFKQQDFQNQQLQEQLQQKDHKHRDYLKQQQRLKAMPLSSSKGMSADTLIGNLLDKKDTFTPRHSSQGPVRQMVEHPEQPGHTAQVRQSSQPAHPSSSLNRTTVGLQNPSDNLPGWLVPNSSRLPPIYSHIWSLVNDAASGGTLVDTNKILALLLTSGLPKEVLGFIWNLATNGANVQLNQQQLYVTLALVALAQMGCTFNNLGVLNFIPTPPIPTFNMSLPKSSVDEKQKRSDLNVKVPAVQTVTPTQSVPPAIVPAPVLTPTAFAPPQNHTDDDDDFDDFTDFQSADTSSVQQSNPPALCTSLPTTAVIQPSMTAKQVVNELNHSVVTKMGRSHGRSIGSRLANHTLGAPKSNVGQKSRRASMDNDNVYIEDDLALSFEKSPNYFKDQKGNEKYQDSSENEDFSDFQVAAGLDVNVDELFPKCHPKSKGQDSLLKESAIRNESDYENLGGKKEEELLDFDSPTSSKAPVAELKSLPTQIEIPFVAPPPNKPQKELMSVEEDKYSALRFFELENIENSTSEPIHAAPRANEADDFGDFVSADDQFAEIAVRDTGYSVKQVNFPVQNDQPTTSVQSAEFQIDDWESSIFQTTKPLVQPSLFDSISTIEPKNSYADLSSAFSDLGISNENQGTSKGDDLLSKTNTPPKLSFDFDMGKETSTLNLNPNFNDNSNDDEFGDFVGPDLVQNDDLSSKSSAGFLSDQLWTESGSNKLVPGPLCDNRSVSSLELPGVSLSRHGSLPSLDLNLFPTNDDSNDKVLNSQISDWLKCLDSSCVLLQAAASTFTNITSHSVLMEVLGTAEGRNYLINLMEVHRVTWRIQRSFQRSGHESNQIDTLLNSIQKVWSTLQTFYKLANIETAVEKDGSDEESGQPACGVCGSPASRGVLEYGGHVYHAPCANLWLNCVDRTLPAHSPLL